MGMTDDLAKCRRASCFSPSWKGAEAPAVRRSGGMEAVLAGMTEWAGWACLFPGVARARASFPFNSF